MDLVSLVTPKSSSFLKKMNLNKCNIKDKDYQGVLPNPTRYSPNMSIDTY